MSKLRVHEIAKEINVPSKDLVEKLQAKGFDVKNHMSTLSEKEVGTIKEIFTEKKAEKKASKEVKEVSESKPAPKPEAAKGVTRDFRNADQRSSQYDRNKRPPQGKTTSFRDQQQQQPGGGYKGNKPPYSQNKPPIIKTDNKTSQHGGQTGQQTQVRDLRITRTDSRLASRVCTTRPRSKTFLWSRSETTYGQQGGQKPAYGQGQRPSYGQTKTCLWTRTETSLWTTGWSETCLWTGSRKTPNWRQTAI